MNNLIIETRSMIMEWLQIILILRMISLLGKLDFDYESNQNFLIYYPSLNLHGWQEIGMRRAMVFI